MQIWMSCRPIRFLQGEVGKFYHENAVIHFPVYLDPEVLKFSARSDDQRLSIEALLNQILKREMAQSGREVGSRPSPPARRACFMTYWTIAALAQQPDPAVQRRAQLDESDFSIL